MQGVEFKGMTGPLCAPKGKEHNVYELPVASAEYSDGMRVVISCWKMTWREWLRVLWTGRVWFEAWGTTHPPVRLDGCRPKVLKEVD